MGLEVGRSRNHYRVSFTVLGKFMYMKQAILDIVSFLHLKFI